MSHVPSAVNLMPLDARPLILGISASSHDAAAALFRGGSCVAAIEEEKLSRVRRSHGLPRQAIQFCLEQAGSTPEQIQFVAVARPMRDRARGAQLAETWIPAWLRRQFPNARVILVDHHSSHAAAAYYPSPFESSTVITLDESGDGRTASVGWAHGLNMQFRAEATFPDSLGALVSSVAMLLGYSAFGDENKLQWLSTLGEPRYAEVFREILQPREGALLHLDPRYLAPADSAAHSVAGFTDRFFAACGIGDVERGVARIVDEQQRADLAASLQAALNDTVLEIARRYACPSSEGNICLGGGVALNSLLVAHLEQSGEFGAVFVQPAAGNAGNALGAALHVAHETLGLSGREPLEHLFLGPEFSDEQIKDVLDNSKLTFQYLPQRKELIAAALKALAQNRILGWFQGRAEFGPRALGARCILASPSGKYVNENLNHYVKHREKFRPFAAAVPAEAASEYFEFSDSARFLASVGQVKPQYRERFAANLLAAPEERADSERRIRVQVVERNSNRLLWELLSACGEATGLPVLFNTSFNLFGEPLVCSPRDAIRSFYCSGLDALLIGPFSLSK